MSSGLLESVGITPLIKEKINNFWIDKNIEMNLPLIDLQHLWLIFLLVEAEDTIEKRNEEEKFEKISLELISYTIEHFTLEEKLFLDFEYPAYISHKRQHQIFIELIKEKFTAFNQQKKAKKKELVSFLIDWICKHLSYEDKQYKQFLDDKQIDLTDWFKSVIKNQEITIDRAQLKLYDEITKSNQLVEMVSENIYRSIHNLWHVYNLRIDIPIIDLQHLWLIRLIVELEFACKNLESKKREEVFRSVVKGALQYTKEHFSVEEKIMQKFSYVDVLSHRKQHGGFIDFLQQRLQDFNKGDALAASKLLKDLKEWLFGHIAITDKRMSASLKELHGDITSYVRELLKTKELVLKKAQIDLYNKIIGIKYF